MGVEAFKVGVQRSRGPVGRHCSRFAGRHVPCPPPPAPRPTPHLPTASTLINASITCHFGLKPHIYERL